MNIAIIDAGTNIFHLLIARQGVNSLSIIETTKTEVKLGQQGITSQQLHNKAMQRGLQAFIEFKKNCDLHQVEKIFAFGTAALRLATNTPLFLKQVYEATGITINVIDGETEATYIWWGVKAAVKLTESPVLIMDIGGGSTEFIIANNECIFWKNSIYIGAALLLENFKPSNPIKLNEIKNIQNFLIERIQTVVDACNIYQPKTLIGASGSFDTFSDIINAQNNLKPSETFDVLDMEQYIKLHKKLLQSTYAERLTMHGMIPIRAEMIVMATILTKLILEKWPFSCLIRSAYSLKEGAMHNTHFLPHTP